MHNHDDKHPLRPEFELGTSLLQAPVDTSEPSGSDILAGSDILEAARCIYGYNEGSTHNPRMLQS